jgi:hypothetical protein
LHPTPKVSVIAIFLDHFCHDQDLPSPGRVHGTEGVRLQRAHGGGDK